MLVASVRIVTFNPASLRTMTIPRDGGFTRARLARRVVEDPVHHGPRPGVRVAFVRPRPGATMGRCTFQVSRVRTAICPHCGRSVVSVGRRGPQRLIHGECQRVRDALRHLETALRLAEDAGYRVPPGKGADAERADLIRLAWRAFPGRLGKTSRMGDR